MRLLGELLLLPRGSRLASFFCRGLAANSLEMDVVPLESFIAIRTIATDYEGMVGIPEEVLVVTKQEPSKCCLLNYYYMPITIAIG
jgi:hypothetical protein